MTQVAEQEVRRWVGGGVLRKEDPELLTGQGHYVDDLVLPGMLWMATVRSPVAHANLTRVDTSAAKQMPGVVGVYTGDELAAEFAAPMPCAWPVADRKMPDEPSGDPRVPEHWPVARGRVRYAGEVVAVVVADTREHALDAVEGVDVDYDELPVVTDMEEALKEGAHVIHEQFGTNKVYTWSLANGDVDKVFSEAPVVVKERYYHPRLIPNAIEPRGVLVQPAVASGEFTIWSATQVPHFLRTLIALTLGISENRIRAIAPEVGGGFGSKLNAYVEEFTAVALARKLGKPIKWVESRSEGYLSTIHGRDVIQHMEVAATEEGKLLGARVSLLADMGAYHQLLSPVIPILGAFLYHGPYDCQAYSFTCSGVFTNKMATDAYRGAGRPESAYAVERTMDALARRVGKDPADVRALNFIPPFSEPTAVASGVMFDSGNYGAALERAKQMVGYDELRREQQAGGGRRNGKLLGVGLSSYIEACGVAPSQVIAALKGGSGGWEAATIRCHPTGKVTVVTGTSPHGQGHVTSWSQIAAEDLEWVNGRFQVAGAPDRAKTIPEVAFSAWTAHNLPEGVEPGLEETAVWDPPNFTFPSGTHICVVEVDAETGAVQIVKYVGVDDCGPVINPLIVNGQLHGGIAQGIAEAMYEEAVYDENGTLVTGNMATYPVPSAAELPSYVLDRIETPSSTNPLGVKGVGEAGTIAAPPAVVNAVADALRPVGVEFIDLPVSAEHVWRAIQSAQGGVA